MKFMYGGVMAFVAWHIPPPPPPTLQLQCMGEQSSSPRVSCLWLGAEPRPRCGNATWLASSPPRRGSKTQPWREPALSQWRTTPPMPWTVISPPSPPNTSLTYVDLSFISHLHILFSSHSPFLHLPLLSWPRNIKYKRSWRGREKNT